MFVILLYVCMVVCFAIVALNVSSLSLISCSRNDILYKNKTKKDSNLSII